MSEQRKGPSRLIFSRRSFLKGVGGGALATAAVV